MGHEIRHLVFDEKCSRNRILSECNEISRHAGETISQIRFLDHVVLNSYEDAMDYLGKADSGWYDCLAVRYREVEKPSKQMLTLKVRQQAAEKAYRALNEMSMTDMTTAQYIGCKQCGSKLSRDYLIGWLCPLCHSDLRSETHKKKVMAAKEKVDHLNELLRITTERAAAKSKTFKWLVKIEYHI